MKLTDLLLVGTTLVYSVGYSSPLKEQTTISSITGVPSRSTRGQEIVVNTIKTDSQPSQYRFLIQGGLHGNEALTSKFVLWLQERVYRGLSPINDLDINFAIDFLPYANPDSYNKFRLNYNGINLNRNFGVLWGKSTEPHGERPFSEAETTAIKRLFAIRRYTAAIDIHGYLNWVVLPSQPQAISQPNNSSAYLKWTKATKENISRLPGYQLKTAYNLGDGGAFEDWAFWGSGSLALCLELKKSKRFFSHRGHSNYDSYLAYEDFIARSLQAAVTIEKSARPKVAEVANSSQSLANQKKPSH